MLDMTSVPFIERAYLNGVLPSIMPGPAFLIVTLAIISPAGLTGMVAVMSAVKSGKSLGSLLSVTSGVSGVSLKI